MDLSITDDEYCTCNSQSASAKSLSLLMLSCEDRHPPHMPQSSCWREHSK